MRTFYLGASEPAWLERTDVPLMLNYDRMQRRRVTLPRARGRWVLNSGAYTHLQQHGPWTLSPLIYAADVRRYRDEIGKLEWAAPQVGPYTPGDVPTVSSVRAHSANGGAAASHPLVSSACSVITT